MSVERGARGWMIHLDLGPSPVRHSELTVRSNREFTAKGCVVESSSDRESWTRLAEGDFFRLGDGPGMERAQLPYPATSSRFLRLVWPETAGFPELREMTVSTEPWPWDDLPELLAPLVPIPIGGMETTFAVDLGVSGLAPRGLLLPRPANGPAGYRLFDRFGPRARIIAQGVAEPDPGSPLIVRLEGSAPLPRRLGLTWHGGEAGLDADGAVRVRHEPSWLVFEAAEPGRFVVARSLTGDDGAGAAGPDVSLFADAWPISAATFGPARRIEAPDPPEDLVARRAPGPRVRAGRRWLVETGPEGRGRVVRLPLLGEAVRMTEGRLDTLRLLMDGELIPFVRRASSEHVLVELVPERDDQANELFLVQPPGAPRMMSIELRAGSGLFTATIELDELMPARPGVEPRRRRIATTRWTCDEAPPLPCFESIETGTLAWPSRLALRSEREPAGEPTPLSLRAWSGYDELVFYMPSAGRVTLESGFQGGETPFPGLEAILEKRGLAPVAVAALKAADAMSGADPSRGSGRWIFIAVLTLVGAALLLVLGRALTRKNG